MPELSFHTNICKELTKGKWSDMENEQKGAKMAFSGTRSLLLWCRQQTEGYSQVNVFNMSTSWRDGLAFCAIIHRYRPDLIDFDRLSKENILENNELAFSMAEKHFGIPMVLDASDMIENAIPDKLSVITYVSQLYEYFKNKTPANQGYSTKMNIQPKARSESTGHKGSKRTSPSHQIYLLSGHAKRVATALRNVFKSDTKEESPKSKEQVHSHGKYLSVDPMRTSLETNRTSEDLSPSMARKSPFLGSDCFVCHSRVFLMERLVVERKLFHRVCFRCDKCSACLRPGTYHYFPETEKFCCLFDCTGAPRKQPIKIKLEPLADVSQEPHTQPSLSLQSSPNLSDKNSTKPLKQEHNKSPLQRQFSVVKRNAITLPALPQPLNQKKTKAEKGPRHSHSSNRPDMSQATKSEGEKKRRFSGGRRVKGKLGGKGKSINSAETREQERTSWSPVNKRRAPDTRLPEKSVSVENNRGDATNCTLNTDGPSTLPLASSLRKLDLLSNEEQVEGKKVLVKPFELKKHHEDRTTTVTEASPNLFFSFKEELLKRATESKGTEGGKLLNGREHVLPEMSSDKDETKLDTDGRGQGIFSENDLDSCESDLKEEDQVNSDKRKCSEDSSSVNSDSTKSVGSHKTSVSDEIEPPVAPKTVQKLREKFLNINDMIEVKHKNNLVKKSVEIQRELRCISAWKQQTDSHVATTRKLSGNAAGKTGELKKPNLGVSCRSVKELRKMYMAGGSSESKAVRGKSNVVRSKSFHSSTSVERKSCGPKTTDTTTGGAEEKCDSTGPEAEENLASCKDVDDSYLSAKDTDNSQQSKHAENSPQPKDENDNSSRSRDIDSVTGDDEGTTSNRLEPCDATELIAVINIDSNHGKTEDNVAAGSQSPLSSENLGSMSHETKAYTVIKSDGVSNEVPSLQIEPASPESINGERCSPGLKRHAASHDSGIDMPSYTQSNLLSSVPDGKVPAGNLKVAAEFSFPGSSANVLTPSEQLLNETSRDLQTPNQPSSPGSDYSPEVLWSLPLSADNRTSLTDTSSSCSSPRMSVIIAQESSTTKINSRFFTVETMEPWDFEDHRIAEEHQCVMEVEGEFSFGREKSRTSRAEREAIFSLRADCKSGSFNSADLIKEEEITLSPSEIDTELQSLEALHRDLERRGVEIEQSLRESMDSERPFNDCEDDLLREWLSVVHERNVILRRESELIYLLQSHNYEERYRTVEGELRKLVAMRDEVKSSDDLKRERELLSELLELVQKRSFIVDSLEEERVREIHEDEKVEQALTDGIAALPENRWEQRQDCTKVAFSRFYC